MFRAYFQPETKPKVKGKDMLKIVAVVGVIAVIGVAGILIYAATLPNDFSVSRSVAINAPPEKIFPLINDNDLKSFNEWNPFAKQDPTIVITYDGPQSGKGAGYSWDSKGKAGKGSSGITNTSPPSRVNMRLDMEKPMEGHPNITFTLEPKGKATEVSWTMAGPYPYINRIFGTIFNMDKIIGGTFASGLSDLKTLAEK
jgi:uncharacterized protein YndB with AHSA1/START domain